MRVVHYHPTLQPSALDRSPTNHETTRSEAIQRSLDDLRSRVHAVESRSHRPDAGATAPMISEEQSRMQLADIHRRLEQEHAAERVDPSWAPTAARILNEDIRRGLSTDGGSVVPVNVDCRATSCIVNVDFPDFSAATRQYSGILSSISRVNCERRVLLPEPEDRTAAYQARYIYFNCQPIDPRYL